MSDTATKEEVKPAVAPRPASPFARGHGTPAMRTVPGSDMDDGPADVVDDNPTKENTQVKGGTGIRGGGFRPDDLENHVPDEVITARIGGEDIGKDTASSLLMAPPPLERAVADYPPSLTEAMNGSPGAENPKDETTNLGFPQVQQNSDGTVGRIITGAEAPQSPTASQENLTSGDAPKTGEQPVDEKKDPEEKKEDDEELAAKNVTVQPFDAFINMLMAPRSDFLAESDEKLQILSQRRNMMLEAASKGQSGGGGGGGFFSKALDKITGSGNGKLPSSVMAVDEEIKSEMARKRLIGDVMFKRVAKSAKSVWESHVEFGNKVEAFNAKFASSAEGQQYYQLLQRSAAARNCSIEQVRKDIRDPNINDPIIVATRDLTRKVCAHPDFANDIAQIENEATKLRRSMDSLHENIGALGRNGVNLSAIEDTLGDKLDALKIPDAAIARPEGEDIGGMGKQMKEQMERISEMVKEFVEGFLQRIGLGRGP